MTTIAFNRECIAADTRVITGGSYYHADKIFRVGNSLLGTAGDGDACLIFVEWFKSPKRNPLQLHKLLGEGFERCDIHIAEINPGGIYLWSGWGVGEKINEPFYAIGSGGTAALEAMRNDHSPEEAVKRAIAHDENTGSPVQVEYLLPPELLPKRKRRGK